MEEKKQKISKELLNDFLYKKKIVISSRSYWSIVKRSTGEFHWYDLNNGVVEREFDEVPFLHQDDLVIPKSKLMSKLLNFKEYEY